MRDYFWAVLDCVEAWVLIPGLMSLGFYGVFWYPNNSVTNREGTKRCPVVYESEIWAILGCLFYDEMMYGCMKPNRFLFVERP